MELMRIHKCITVAEFLFVIRHLSEEHQKGRTDTLREWLKEELGYSMALLDASALMDAADKLALDYEDGSVVSD